MKQAIARGSSWLRSDQATTGRPIGGKPCGTSPSIFTPRASRLSKEATTIPPTTTNNPTGLFFKNSLPNTSMTRAPTPIESAAQFVSLRCEMKWAERLQKLPSPPLNPNSFGSCVLARYNATPALNPTKTVSEMKLTIAPALTSHAMKEMSATSSAVHAANAPKRDTSPPANPDSEEPIRSEIAEVTVMAV